MREALVIKSELMWAIGFTSVCFEQRKKLKISYKIFSFGRNREGT